MLVLLPPSAGKTAPPSGPPVDFSALAYPQLTKLRRSLVAAADRRLRTASAAPAAEVYTGVLYGHLGLPDLDRAAWDRVLIASALWGVVRPADRIPAYTFDMGVKLPRIGGLAAFWRPALARALPDAGLVLDLRSGSYAAAWRPRAATVVGVRGFTERPDGSRTAITHMAKRVRGDVARLVLQAGGDPSTPQDLGDIARAGGLRVELAADGSTLDVIEPAGTVRFERR